MILNLSFCTEIPSICSKIAAPQNSHCPTFLGKLGDLWSDNMCASHLLNSLQGLNCSWGGQIQHTPKMRSGLPRLPCSYQSQRSSLQKLNYGYAKVLTVARKPYLTTPKTVVSLAFLLFLRKVISSALVLPRTSLWSTIISRSLAIWLYKKKKMKLALPQLDIS